MKYMFYLISILPTMSFAQSKVGIQGSMFIMGVGNDGIMLAEDSREVIIARDDTSENKHVYGYYDSNQKLFIAQGNKVIAITGWGFVGNYGFQKIVHDFDKTLNGNLPIEQYLPGLLNFIKQFCAPDLFAAFTVHETILIAGYENGIPKIGASEKNYPVGYQEQTEMAASSEPSNFQSKYNNKLSCDSLGKLAAQSIYETAKATHRENQVGGKIARIQITPKEIKWIANKPVLNYDYTLDLCYDIMSDKIKLTYSSKQDSITAKKMIEDQIRFIRSYVPKSR